MPVRIERPDKGLPQNGRHQNHEERTYTRATVGPRDKFSLAKVAVVAIELLVCHYLRHLVRGRMATDTAVEVTV